MKKQLFIALIALTSAAVLQAGQFSPNRPQSANEELAQFLEDSELRQLELSEMLSLEEMVDEEDAIEESIRESLHYEQIENDALFALALHYESTPRVSVIPVEASQESLSRAARTQGAVLRALEIEQRIAAMNPTAVTTSTESVSKPSTASTSRASESHEDQGCNICMDEAAENVNDTPCCKKHVCDTCWANVLASQKNVSCPFCRSNKVLK